MIGIFIPLILITGCSFLLWRSCSNFDRHSKVVGANLSDGVRGASVNAIASSLPEFFTALFFLFIVHDVEGFSAGLATILGSAIFNILLIPAFVIIILIKNGHDLAIRKKLIIRDAGILLVSQLALLYFIQDGVISLIDSFYLFLIYLSYLFILSRGVFFTKNDKPLMNKQRLSSSLKGIAKSIVLMSIWCFILVFACELLGNKEYPEYLSFIGPAHGIGWNLMFVALIFAAAASSVPDMLISCLDAKRGDSDDSISNPIASNLFDICIAFGIPLFLYTLFNGEISFEQSDALAIGDLTKLIVLMVFVTLVFLMSILASKTYTLTHSILFILIYGVFMFLVFNLDFIPTIASFF